MPHFRYRYIRETWHWALRNCSRIGNIHEIRSVINRNRAQSIAPPRSETRIIQSLKTTTIPDSFCRSLSYFEIVPTSSETPCNILFFLYKTRDFFFLPANWFRQTLKRTLRLRARHILGFVSTVAPVPFNGVRFLSSGFYKLWYANCYASTRNSYMQKNITNTFTGM